MNPIAIGMVALGVLLLGAGLFLVIRHRKSTGITVAVLGICAIIFPFVITYYLFR
jgi:hypothetical protein